MNHESARLIHTGLYGAHAKEILDAVAGQLSDGMWENSRGYDKYWTNFNVVQADDGEILFEVNSKSYTTWGRQWITNPFVEMSSEQFKQWYAKKLKAVIMQEFRDEGVKNEWNRRNVQFESSYLNYKLDVNVADIYCVYDQLLGREIGIAKYDVSTICRVFGTKKTDEEAARAKDIREKKELVYAKYKELLRQNTDEMNAEIERVKKLFDDKKQALLDSQRKDITSIEACPEA